MTLNTSFCSWTSTRPSTTIRLEHKKPLRAHILMNDHFNSRKNPAYSVGCKQKLNAVICKYHEPMFYNIETTSNVERKEMYHLRKKKKKRQRRMWWQQYVSKKLGQGDVYHCLALTWTVHLSLGTEGISHWSSSFPDSNCSTVLLLFCHIFHCWNVLNVFSWWKIWIAGQLTPVVWGSLSALSFWKVLWPIRLSG